MEPGTQRLTSGRLLKGVVAAATTFGGLGTVAALWENPLFIRMTPAGNGEIGLLVLLAVLVGAFVAVRRPACSAKATGVGGVLGFLGIACPVCNKVLLVVFGGDLLLTYFEPVRIYVAALGVAITGWAVLRELRQRGGVACEGLPERAAGGHS